jgi:MSHA pilin protein MshB
MAVTANNRQTRIGRYNYSQGFTFIELVIVIILLGLLAATALPRYLDATGDAEIASLEGVAGGFGTAAVIARAQWFADGNKRGEATSPADKVAIDLDGKIIYMNENGWPANTDPSADASEDSQTSVECQQIWNGLLQGAPSSTIDRDERANARYFIEVLDENPDKCRYEFILNNNPSAAQTHYFDFDLRDGTVEIFKPDQT